MAQAANVIRFPRITPQPTSAWDTGGVVIPFPGKPNYTFSRVDRHTMRAAARGFENIVDGLPLTDTALRIEVRRHLRDLRMVHDPLMLIQQAIIEIDMALRMFNKLHPRRPGYDHGAFDYDDVMDVLEEAAAVLHAALARREGGAA